MRFILICLLMVLGQASFAKSMNLQEFKRLDLDSQVRILKAYKDFVTTYQKKAPELAAISSPLSLSLIPEAFAASEFSCFYAGWPSKSVVVTRSGKKKELCNNPAANNPNYAAAQSANGCRSSELACNPALFGQGLCVDISTRQKKNLAFSQCEQKFKSQGKDLAAVAREISEGSFGTEADEVFQLVSEVCSSGFQSATGMCRNLENRVAEIQKLKPESSVAEVETSESTSEPDPAATSSIEKAKALVKKAVESVKDAGKQVVEKVSPKPKPTHESIHVSHNGQKIEASDQKAAILEAVKNTEKLTDTVAHVHTADCEDDHDHINTPEPAPESPKAPTGPFQRVFCEKPVAQVQSKTREELDRILKENNVEIVSEISNEQYLWDFVAELQRFPATLRRELASAGGKIHIFDDSVSSKKGVTADPSWSRGAKIEGKEGRSWDTLPGSGGWVGTTLNSAVPTRIAVNKLTPGPGSNHGCTSLFLHEHGHMLGNRYGPGFGLHNQPEFKALLQDPNWGPVMGKLCANNYCNQNNEADREEAFAELFAYYHTCEKSRQSLEEHFPAAAEYMRRLTTLRSRRPAGAPL